MSEVTGGGMADSEDVLFRKNGLTVTRNLVQLPDQTIRIRDITSLSVEGSVGQNLSMGCVFLPGGFAIVGLATIFGTIVAMIALLGVIIFAGLFVAQAVASAGTHRLVVRTGGTKQDDVFTSRAIAEVEQLKAIIESLMR